MSRKHMPCRERREKVPSLHQVLPPPCSLPPLALGQGNFACLSGKPTGPSPQTVQGAPRTRGQGPHQRTCFGATAWPGRLAAGHRRVRAHVTAGWMHAFICVPGCLWQITSKLSRTRTIPNLSFSFPKKVLRFVL